MLPLLTAPNKGIALSGGIKHAKVSSKQKFKSSEMQTSEGGSTENEHGFGFVEKKDRVKKGGPFYFSGVDLKNKNKGS